MNLFEINLNDLIRMYAILKNIYEVSIHSKKLFIDSDRILNITIKIYCWSLSPLAIFCNKWNL